MMTAQQVCDLLTEAIKLQMKDVEPHLKGGKWWSKVSVATTQWDFKNKRTVMCKPYVLGVINVRLGEAGPSYSSTVVQLYLSEASAETIKLQVTNDIDGLREFIGAPPRDG